MSLPRDDVEFGSHGATLRGWRYRGTGRGPRPGVVMAHGLSAVKEMYLDRYAEVFALAGCTVLVHDHFGFGASGGEPRQYPSPGIQMEGYRDAVAWLGSDPDVDADRIGLWGTSFSGGEVIGLAAEDLPVRCAVAQVPGFGEGARLPSGGLAAFVRAFETGDTGAVIAATTDSPDGEAVMYADGAHRWFHRTAAERAPSWRNELRIQAFGEPFHALAHVAGARVPLLLLVAPDDTLTPPGPAMDAIAASANVTAVEIPGGHFDAYEAGFEASAGPAADWFRRHLGA